MTRATFFAASVAFAAALGTVSGIARAGYSETSLISDGFVPAQNMDANLKNPWQISFGPTSPFWVADNNAGVSTLYNTSGALLKTVTIPPPAGSPAGTLAAPTGNIFNSTTDFDLSPGKPATFIFSTEDGTISAWAGGSAANLKVDNSASGAVYKGLAMDNNGTANMLYATNFRSGNVDVFDASFKPTTVSGGFKDPNLPAGYAPFGIQNVNGKLFVTYALQDDAKHDDVHAPGNGFVDVFDANGVLQQRLVSGGPLNSPWGLTLAPATFGTFANDLLVGNFGNSEINAFDPKTGQFLGTLSDSSGNPLSLTDTPGADGLWGITFGNGGSAGAANTLFFASGVNGESDGLFGSVSASLTPSAVPLPNSGCLAAVGMAGLLVGAGARRWFIARRGIN